jgi:hypothetical protein
MTRSRSVTDDAPLRDLANETLRRVARGACWENRVGTDACDLMRRTCRLAQARGVRAEQLLLLLKESWRVLPEALRIPRHQAEDVLARAITACIDEYYANEGQLSLRGDTSAPYGPRAATDRSTLREDLPSRTAAPDR